MPPHPLGHKKPYSALGQWLLYQNTLQSSGFLRRNPPMPFPSVMYLDTFAKLWYTPRMDTQTHTTLDIITVADPAPLVDPSAPPGEVFDYPPLSQDEETFALAVVECAGNIAAAYKMTFGTDAYMPLAKGKELLCKPAIALKIRAITDAVQDASLISVGAHLDQLAKIRDLSIETGQMKVAYHAERSRGEAVGIYQKHEAAAKGKGNNQAVQINISMASKHDETI